MRQTSPLESPFAWKTESYTFKRERTFFPEGSNPSISFSARRTSKILGYIPLIGTIIGIFRIHQGIQEYKYFKHEHLHALSHRSIKWVARGVLETIPTGGLICLIIDVTATILYRGNPSLVKLEDETDCGYCHTCEGCKC